MQNQWLTVLDNYSDLLAHFVASQNVLAPLLLLFVEEAGVPIFIPGDLVLAYTGYRISTATLTPLWLATLVALIAVLSGATILFLLARHWGKQLVWRFGRFIFLDEATLTRAEHGFRRYGVLALIVGRHIPGLRIPLTIMAGLSGMRYITFLLCTVTSTLAWIVIYLSLGRHYGPHLRVAFQHSTALAFSIIGIGIAISVFLHFRGRRRTTMRRRSK